MNELENAEYLFKIYERNWNKFARDELRVRLDRDQEQILHAIQTERKVSVRSGNARGKDFVAAVASICFLNLNIPSKVINTAPTGRQAISIMMSEISQIYRKANSWFLGGNLLTNQIKFERPDCYLLAFKAKDKAIEAWTGFHSPNLMVVVTEASGIGQETFNAIESILTGNSKLVIVFNPNQCRGEAWKSVKDPSYVKFKLNCLNAPNVLAKKTLIPGQVDYGWVRDKVDKWCIKIEQSQAVESEGDFEFEGGWHRPNDLFLVKVMGEFPKEGDDKLIPLAWIEAAQERWREMDKFSEEPLKLGVDVAGMGRDLTVFCYRYGDVVTQFRAEARSDHMATAGRIKLELDRDRRHQALIDTIGEGAGVYSRLLEQGANCIGVKFSENARGYSDLTMVRKFANMRAYCWWAIRDALDPRYEPRLALPSLDELTQDLNEPLWKVRSDGSIIIEEKDEIKKRLGRSPDYGDALAMTFYPTFGELDVYVRASEPH